MKLTHRFIVGLLVLVLAAVTFGTTPSAFAQDTPDSIREVMIRDLASRFGIAGRPSSWRHTVETSSDSNLGCPLLNVGSPLANPVNVYVTTLNYGGTQYTYRISQDQSIVVVCDTALLSQLGVGVAGPSGVVGINQVSCDAANGFYTLGINATGRVTLPDLTLFQDLDPSSNIVATLPSGATMSVVDGPFCDPDLVWWLVNVNGLLGYTHEINYVQNIRFIELVTSGGLQPGSGVGVAGPGLAAGSTTCPLDFAGYLPPRLIVGFQGRVESGGINNIIRASYGRSANYLTEMPPGSSFSVIGGPECTGANLGEAIVWFQVNWNGTVGWTAESFNGDYFVEPLAGSGDSLPASAGGPPPGAIQPTFNSPTGLPRYALPPAPSGAIALNTAPGVIYQGALALPTFATQVDIAANGTLVLAASDGPEVYQLAGGGTLEPLFKISYDGPFAYHDLSSDGSTLAVTRTNPAGAFEVVLYDAQTGNQKTVIPLQSVLGMWDVELSSDGSIVAVAYETGNTQAPTPIVEVYTPAQNLHVSLPHSSTVTNLALAPDNGVLATYSWNNDQILVWSLRDNTVISTWDSDVTGTPDLSGGRYVAVMTFNASGTQLAIGGHQGVVEVWSLIGQIRLSSIPLYSPGFPGAVQALAFSPDGNVLAAAGVNRSTAVSQPDEPLMLINLTNGQVFQTLTTPVRHTFDMAFSPDALRLFALTQADSMLIYSVR